MFAQFTGVGPVNVYLHPDDLALLEKRLEGKSLTQGNAEPRLLAEQGADGGDVACTDQREDIVVGACHRAILSVVSVFA